MLWVPFAKRFNYLVTDNKCPDNTFKVLMGMFMREAMSRKQCFWRPIQEFALDSQVSYCEVDPIGQQPGAQIQNEAPRQGDSAVPWRNGSCPLASDPDWL